MRSDTHRNKQGVVIDLEKSKARDFILGEAPEAIEKAPHFSAGKKLNLSGITTLN